MKIIDLIKKACKNKGVDIKHAARIEKALKVSKAEDIESSIDSFKENILPVLEEVEANAKKTADKLSKEEAGKAAIKAFIEKHNLNEDGTPIIKKTPESDKMDPTVKALFEKQNQQIEELKGLITSNKEKAETTEKRGQALKLVSEFILDKNKAVSWAKRVDVDSETPIENQVNALKDEYTDIQQAGIQEKVESGEYTPGFRQPKERSEEEWAKLMNEEENNSSNSGVVDLGIN